MQFTTSFVMLAIALARGALAAPSGAGAAQARDDYNIGNVGLPFDSSSDIGSDSYNIDNIFADFFDGFDPTAGLDAIGQVGNVKRQLSDISSLLKSLLGNIDPIVGGVLGDVPIVGGVLGGVGGLGSGLGGLDVSGSIGAAADAEKRQVVNVAEFLTELQKGVDVLVSSSDDRTTDAEKRQVVNIAALLAGVKQGLDAFVDDLGVGVVDVEKRQEVDLAGLLEGIKEGVDALLSGLGVGTDISSDDVILPTSQKRQADVSALVNSILSGALGTSGIGAGSVDGSGIEAGLPVGGGIGAGLSSFISGILFGALGSGASIPSVPSETL